MRVIDRRGSCQQPLASGAKKAEGKRELPPCTPYREKGRAKKQDGIVNNVVSKAARARARRPPCTCSYAEAGDAAAEIVANCFPSHAKDISLWAWYCRHFDRRRIVDRAYYYASCRRQDEVNNAVTAFQAWLRKEYGERGGAA